MIPIEIEEMEIKPKINMCRRRDDGLRMWYVSFATPKSSNPKEHQFGYYQLFYNEPNLYDLNVVYNNFIAARART